jgi:hypothetical protein
MMEATAVKGEKAKMLHVRAETVTEAMASLGPLIDWYIGEDWILQSINVTHDYKEVYLIATVSRWKS